MRDGNTALLEEFDRFFNESVSEIVALTREVIDRATEIRSRYGFKTPDAIHLAAANLANCELFLTNDPRLNRFTELQIKSSDRLIGSLPVAWTTCRLLQHK